MLITCSRDRKIRVWDLENLEKSQSCGFRKAEIYCIDTSRDGNLIVCGSKNGKIVVYRRSHETEQQHRLWSYFKVHRKKVRDLEVSEEEQVKYKQEFP